MTAAHLPDGTANSVFLWSGKGHDEVARSHGSSVLDDAWLATLNGPTATGKKTDQGVGWSQIPQDPLASPDRRWKSSGDMLPGYFVAFGGDDLVTFLNDLWVLPMGEAQAVVKLGLEVGEHSVDDADDPRAEVRLLVRRGTQGTAVWTRSAMGLTDKAVLRLE
jgi:hypothetical protein